MMNHGKKCASNTVKVILLNWWWVDRINLPLVKLSNVLLIAFVLHVRNSSRCPEDTQLTCIKKKFQNKSRPIRIRKLGLLIEDVVNEQLHQEYLWIELVFEVALVFAFSACNFIKSPVLFNLTAIPAKWCKTSSWSTDFFVTEASSLGRTGWA